MSKQVVLHSGLTPSAAADALRRSIDEDKWSFFAISGYKGDQPVLGTVTGNTFRLHKRRYYRNSFAPYFYGQMTPEGSGTRIEGYFDMIRWVKYFMWGWLAIVITSGLPVFLTTLLNMMHGEHRQDELLGVLLPPGMALFGFLLPKFGRFLGRREEAYILQHLQNVLNARMEPLG